MNLDLYKMLEFYQKISHHQLFFTEIICGVNGWHTYFSTACFLGAFTCSNLKILRNAKAVGARSGPKNVSFIGLSLL